MIPSHHNPFLPWFFLRPKIEANKIILFLCIFQPSFCQIEFNPTCKNTTKLDKWMLLRVKYRVWRVPFFFLSTNVYRSVPLQRSVKCIFKLNFLQLLFSVQIQMQIQIVCFFIYKQDFSIYGKIPFLRRT